MKKAFNKRNNPIFYSISLVLIFVIFSFLVTRLVIDNTMKFIITARITELTTTTTVRVRSVVYDIVAGCLQNSIIQGNPISANVTVTNKGSYQGDMQINWWAEDSSGKYLNVSGSSAVNVQPTYVWTSIKTLSLPSSISSGVYRFKFNVSAPGYIGTAHCSFEVASPVITIPPAAGGGGPAGQPPTQNETGPIKETATVQKISAGEEGTFDYKVSGIAVNRISVRVIESAQNVKVSVAQGSCSREVENPPDIIYQMLCIEKENIENINIKDAKIRFKVDKPWFSKNEISLSSISLYKYTNEWNKLTTALVDEDTNNYYFEAKTFGFSTFAISGKRIGEEKQVDVSYPSSISAFINSTKKVYIQIKNHESESLKNLKLILQGLELSWFKIIPSSMTLNASSTQEFVIEFTIPADAPIKAYLVNLIVKSDEFEEYLKMKINILEVLPREKIQEKINDLEEESVNLGNRLDELKRVGVEVVAVERLLEVAKEKLDEARSELQIENYGKASEILHDVEILLDDIEETILTGPFKIKPLSLILGGVILTGILALSVGKIRLLSKGKKVEEKKLKYSFLKKIQSAFASRNCPRCHREMQEMYKDNKLIGYRCSKCKYTRYKGG